MLCERKRNIDLKWNGWGWQWTTRTTRTIQLIQQYVLEIKQNNNEQIGFVHYGWT